ncbi:MAG TPA: T9SS type A sorting domain-containing protein [bacterium]|nr:T9SS type A sorting domain-containing protein [bacterium]HPN43773.1 T9SS type A sorting domain-containing protein [bacterium]
MNKYRCVIAGLFLLICSLYNSLYSLDYQETQLYYIIENGKYTALLSKQNGMIESLKLANSDLDIVSEYPNFSLFFTEFVYEYPDAIRASPYYPSRDLMDIKTTIKKYPDIIIVSVKWTTGMIDASWDYFFEPGKKYFRVEITRTVVKDAVYSNFQQCTMYTPAMDNSFIINYKGDIQLTKGVYKGGKKVTPVPRETGDNLPATNQHSIWTVFDYGTPAYFPTIAWNDNDTDINVGYIIVSSTPNQRRSLSYHGGGVNRESPGFAEAQYNWFGKSDSEALFLRKGTSFSMELYYYQDHGEIDSLWNFNQSLLSSNYIFIPAENYVAASWGGRTSPHPKYYWRYPQVTSNYITSQELFRHRAFSIPLSQNGTADPHLFSLNIIKYDNNKIIDLTPYSGSRLFNPSIQNSNHITYSGSLSWDIDNITSTLKFSAFPDKRHITVSGYLATTDNNLKNTFIQFVPSPRLKYLIVDSLNTCFSFIAEDVLLDTISIGIDNLVGIKTFICKQDTLLLEIDNSQNSTTGNFQFDLFPTIQKSYRHELQNQEDLVYQETYKAYFINTFSKSGLSYLPSADYYLFNDYRNEVEHTLKLYASNSFESLFISQDSLFSDIASIKTESGMTTNVEIIPHPNNIYEIKYAFKANNLYIINIEKNSTKTVTNFMDIISSYPNPFVSSAYIYFFLNQVDDVGCKIYNIQGQLVEEFAPIRFISGFNNYHIKMMHNHPTGVYFLQLYTPKISKTLKVLYIQ